MLPGHERTHFTVQKVEGKRGEDLVEVTQWQSGKLGLRLLKSEGLPFKHGSWPSLSTPPT